MSPVYDKPLIRRIYGSCLLCSRTLPVSGNTSTPTPIEEKRGRGDLSATSNSKAPWKLAESARGVSPRAAHRTVLEALTSYGSCPSIKAAAFRRSDEFLRFPVDPAVAPRETRPLRSGPITGPSSLLRGGPPQPSALVLSPRGFGRLCFSLCIQGLVPAVPRGRLCSTHALSTPTAARPVTRLPTGLSQETPSPLVSTALDTLTTRHRRVHLRSPLGKTSCPSQSRDFSPDVHYHGSSTAAARAGLRPAPESRFRGAVPHHQLSIQSTAEGGYRAGSGK